MMVLLVVAIIGLGGQAVAAEDPFEYDISTLIGITAGELKRPESASAPASSLIFGGLEIGLRSNYPWTESWLGHSQIRGVIDFTNAQLTSQSIGFGVTYHLLGGSRKIFYGSSRTRLTKSFVNALSLVNQVSFEKFSYASSQSSKLNIDGSILQVRNGVAYRRNISNDVSWATEILYSTFGFAASTDRLAYQGFDLTMDIITEF